MPSTKKIIAPIITSHPRSIMNPPPYTYLEKSFSNSSEFSFFSFSLIISITFSMNRRSAVSIISSSSGNSARTSRAKVANLAFTIWSKSFCFGCRRSYRTGWSLNDLFAFACDFLAFIYDFSAYSSGLLDQRLLGMSKTRFYRIHPWL